MASRTGILQFQAVLLLLHLLAIGLFSYGFLLTRVELSSTSACSDFEHLGYSSFCSDPRFSKVVVVIVDALRFDFFHSSNTVHQHHHNLLPRLKKLAADSGPAAVSAKFVADPPTTTMQRLKAWLTGALPTFVDVGNSFSASAVTEDNLADQLHRQGRKLVFVGDDTWTQLVPHVFHVAHDYPSFNVRDLHTVDDGVWEHLPSLLRSAQGWDVLIAHYLGVDHAGHTHGVNSGQMRDKLRQMDEQVANITEYLISEAGAGGAHEHTLLLVLSDHGQTMLGDHGGGSDEEVDSVLLAVNVGQAHTWMQQQQQQQQQSSGAAAEHATAANAAAAPAAAEAVAEAPCWDTVVPQMDLTATLSAWLGVPPPFGNLGKVSPWLWRVVLRGAQQGATCQDSTFAGWSASEQQDYVHTLMTNAAQVHRYLLAYSAKASLPAARLAQCARLYEQAAELYAAHAGEKPGEAAEKLLRFLEAAAQLARQQFTQFNMGFIVAGCALMVLTVMLQGVKSWQSFGGFGPWCYSPDTLACLAGISFHTGAIFSTNLIMAEGRVQCALVVALGAMLLLRACLAAAWKLRQVKHHRPRRAAPGAHAAPALQGETAQLQSEFLLQHGGSAAAAAGPATAEAVEVGSAWRPVFVALVLVGTSTALWRYGLIDRTGQDPHDKSHVDSGIQLAEGQQMGWAQQVLQLQLPLLAVPLLFHWGLARLGQGLRSAHWAVLAVWLEYALVALWWSAQLHGGAAWMASPADLLQSAPGHIEQLASASTSPASLHLLRPILQWLSQSLQHFLSQAHIAAASCAVPPHQLSPDQQQQHLQQQRLSPWQCAAAGAGSWLATGLQLPLKLLLPRLVYATCLAYIAAGVCRALVTAAVGRARASPPAAQTLASGSSGGSSGGSSSGSSSSSRAGVAPGSAVRAAAAVVATAGVVSGPLTVLLGLKGPVVVLLAAVQWVCTTASLRYCRTRTSASPAEQGQTLAAQELAAGQTPGATAAATAAATATAIAAAAAKQAASAADLAYHPPKSRNGPGAAGGPAPQVQPQTGAAVRAMAAAPAGVAATCAHLGDSSSFVFAALAAMQGVQLFFCSGHFCEFSGLQYASSFVGFDDMHWYRSGLLLLLNTFGLHCMPYLLLPALAAASLPPHVPSAASTQQASKPRRPDQHIHRESDTAAEFTPSRPQPTNPTAAEHTSAADPAAHPATAATARASMAAGASHAGSTASTASAAQCFAASLQRVVLVAGLVRGLNAAAALISAGYQRRHLLVWALFAPKLVFELWLLVTSHVACLAALAVVACLP